MTTKTAGISLKQILGMAPVSSAQGASDVLLRALAAVAGAGAGAGIAHSVAKPLAEAGTRDAVSQLLYGRAASQPWSLKEILKGDPSAQTGVGEVWDRLQRGRLAKDFADYFNRYVLGGGVETPVWGARSVKADPLHPSHRSSGGLLERLIGGESSPVVTGMHPLQESPIQVAVRGRARAGASPSVRPELSEGVEAWHAGGPRPEPPKSIRKWGPGRFYADESVGFIDPDRLKGVEEAAVRTQEALHGRVGTHPSVVPLVDAGGALAGAILAERLANSAINRQSAKAVSRIQKMLMGAGAGTLAAGAIKGAYD